MGLIDLDWQKLWKDGGNTKVLPEEGQPVLLATKKHSLTQGSHWIYWVGKLECHKREEDGVDVQHPRCFKRSDNAMLISFSDVDYWTYIEPPKS